MPHEWKIRSMDEADSSAAVEAAQRAKVTTAVWVGRAIREAVMREREPITGEPLEPEPRARTQQDVQIADRVVSLVDAACHLAATRGVPQTVRKTANQTVEQSLRAFSGALEDDALGRPQLISEAPRQILGQPSIVAGGDEPQETLEGAGLVQTEHC